MDHYRVIIAMDVDCFYPQAEMLRDPSLRGKPVGVQQKMLVISTSYEARRFGINKGDSVREVRRKCPEIIIRNGEDLAYYTEVSERWWRFVEAWTDNAPVERLGLDELFVDATNVVEVVGDPPCVGHASCEGAFDEAYRAKVFAASKYADDLRRAVRDALGLATSAGVATNKLLAKLAASRHKPFDQTVVVPTSRAIREILNDDLRLTKIPGIGFATGRDLKDRYDAETIGELRGLPASTDPLVRAALALCDGRDDSPVRPSGRPLAVGVEESFWQRPLPGITDRLVDAIDALCDKLVVKLAADQRSGRDARPTSLIVGVKKITSSAPPPRAGAPLTSALSTTTTTAGEPYSRRATRRRRYDGPDLGAPIDDPENALPFKSYVADAAARLLADLVAPRDALHILGLSLRFPDDRPPPRDPAAAAVLASWLRAAPKRRKGDATKAPAPDDQPVARLVDMGFSAPAAAEALEDARGDEYGYLPDIARVSKGNISALPAESLCERIISAPNTAMTEGNTLLSDEELDMLVTCA
ncbi:hypothetical protein CTAYLR_006085 [Chrysophaeum taylorii]|uniref:UmuC domain-containing protein n=1 Tax=Chrysophaeum taylorii TaxID=2483200 RepID=A0AAD7UK77_9STRA|nr:hypothetical protein CTAYLR_006085 [Chrysophaeum taylorii]